MIQFSQTEKFSFPPSIELIDLQNISLEELSKFSINYFPLIIKIVINNNSYLIKNRKKFSNFNKIIYPS